MDERRCVICGKPFNPDQRARLQQKCCSRRCSKKLKRQRDKIHKERYRETGLGKEQRKRESRKCRESIGWNAYMRAWRKAKPEERSRQERERAKRYHLKHRPKILERRRQKRAAAKCAENGPKGAWSH